MNRSTGDLAKGVQAHAAARIASALSAAAIRSTQALGLRGGPTLVRLLAATGLGRGSISRVTLPSGQRIAFPTADPYWAPYLWGRRTYEPDVQEIFRRLARVPGKLLVDGGANIGYWTVQMSAPEFGFDRFIAVEANPALIPLLEENVKANGIDCTVVHAALAATTGRTVYLGGTENHAAAAVGASGTAVKTTSLDALVPRDLAADRMVVVKLDIEGSEIAAFQGAQSLSQRDSIFIYEDWPRGGFINSEWLLANGFSVVGMAPGGQAREIASLAEADAYNRSMRRSYGPSNFIAVSQSMLPRVFELLAGDERLSSSDSTATGGLPG